MKPQSNPDQEPGATPTGAVSPSPDEVLQWAWAEASARLAAGEDLDSIPFSEISSRFHHDLRENGSNPMLWTDPRCSVVKADRLGPFAAVGDGTILAIGDNETFTSRDDGVTWSEPRRMCPVTAKSRPGECGVLTRTRQGHLVYAYLDIRNCIWSWDNEKREAADDVRLDVWSIRSEDEGRTWRDRKRVFAGYCGALINMIETSNGELVLPIQRLIRNPSRHALCVYVSRDEGRTWEESRDIIDLGGHGNHDGAMEPTIVQLRDGRLWMLIRTNLDCFWSAYSSDGGRTWPVLRPSQIDASTAPGAMLRLASGRLVLTWNRLRAVGSKTYRRWGGDEQWSLRPASGHREELSLAFSEDDGATWSPPEVIIRYKGNGVSYPYLFELEPGRIWVSTLFSYRMALIFAERDFVGQSSS